YYPDASTTHRNLLQHLLSFTAPEIRNPSPNVDVKSFSARFPSGGIHPLVHYALHADRLLRHSDRVSRKTIVDGLTEWAGEAEFWRRCAQAERERQNSFQPRPIDLIRCEPGLEE